MLRKLIVGLTLMLPGANLEAQAVGSQMPPFELKGLSQSPAKSVAELEGRAILIDFFAFWWVPCAGQVSHLNQLHKEFEAKGLTIIGVTGESEEKTIPWVKKRKALYPFAYDTGVGAFFGVIGIPYAVLLDTEGTIIWKGHPAALSNDLIKIATRGAIEQPLYEWPGEASEVKQALMEHRFAKALRKSKNLDARFGKMVQQRVDHLIGTMQRARKRGDYLLAKQQGLRALRECRDLPAQNVARELLDDLKASQEIRLVLRAQVKLRQLVQKGLKATDRKAARAVLKEMKELQIQEQAGIVGKHAKREMSILEGRIRELPSKGAGAI